MFNFLAIVIPCSRAGAENGGNAMLVAVQGDGCTFQIAENTNVVADWAATLLNNFYFGDEGFSNLSKNDVYFSPFGVTLDCLFIEYLLNEGDFEIFDSNGNKVKKSPEGAIF